MMELKANISRQPSGLYRGYVEFQNGATIWAFGYSQTDVLDRLFKKMGELNIKYATKN